MIWTQPRQAPGPAGACLSAEATAGEALTFLNGTRLRYSAIAASPVTSAVSTRLGA